MPKIISTEELKEILEKHKLWLQTRYDDEPKGEQANLEEANLNGANLERANLEQANLYGANLYGANLNGANLERANLYGANLYGANLERANLEGAYLYGANLNGANLYRANLHGANLYGANLEQANLYRANLYGANLNGANLERANLDEKEEIRKGYILKENLIAYKKCKDYRIVELCIPKGSIVFSINNGKCRTNRAKILSISSIDGKKKYKLAKSKYDNKFIYRIGEELEIDNFDLMYNVECGAGIHFFRTRQEAEEY